MCSSSFFRPWNLSTGNGINSESVQHPQCSPRVNHCNFLRIEDLVSNDNKPSSVRLLCHSVGDDISMDSNSLEMLSNFVYDTHSDNRPINCSRPSTSDQSALAYAAALSNYQSTVYNHLSAPLYYTMEDAVALIHQQDMAAKMNKKLRPKKFKCEYCNVAFSNNGQLKGHIRIHTGERPFHCDAEGCGKSFTRNEELTRHKRIHTGLRPHTCVICGKSFGRKDHLKKHARTHGSRDPYLSNEFYVMQPPSINAFLQYTLMSS